MRLRIARHHNGIGDWLMVLASLRWLRAQHPDIEVVMDFTNAPHIAQEAYAASDLQYKDARTYSAHADISLPHLVYPLRGFEPYMTGLARTLSEATGRHVAPMRDDLPFANIAYVPAGQRAFAIVGHGKGINRGGKEWGRENFASLAVSLMERGYELRQVGGAKDFPIPGVRQQYLGLSFASLCQVLLNTRAFIGIENGLMIIAGFLRLPLVTIYNGAPGSERIDFDNHLKIVEAPSSNIVLHRLTEWLD